MREFILSREDGEGSGAYEARTAQVGTRSLASLGINLNHLYGA